MLLSAFKLFLNKWNYCFIELYSTVLFLVTSSQKTCQKNQSEEFFPQKEKGKYPIKNLMEFIHVGWDPIYLFRTEIFFQWNRYGMLTEHGLWR